MAGIAILGAGIFATEGNKLPLVVGMGNKRT